MGEYSRVQRVFECAVVGVFCLLAAWGLTRIPLSLWLLPVAVCAWLATDLLSGLVHWAFDTWGSTRTRFFGPWFIRSFREHHLDPRAMAGHDFVETNGSSAIAAMPLALLGIGLAPGQLQAFVVFLALGALFANQCHRWAHLRAAERPAFARLAQRLRLSLSPEVHRLHHARPHDSYYCTASGWMNRGLEGVGFFRWMERGVWLVGRVVPRRDEVG